MIDEVPDVVVVKCCLVLINLVAYILVHFVRRFFLPIKLGVLKIKNKSHIQHPVRPMYSILVNIKHVGSNWI